MKRKQRKSIKPTRRKGNKLAVTPHPEIVDRSTLPALDISEADDLRKQLNMQQRAFVDDYLSNGFSGRRAAINAGYSPDCAYVQSCRLLKQSKVRRIVDLHADAATYTAKQVMARLSEMASINVADFVDEDGKLIPGALTRLGHLVKGFKVPTEERGMELDLHDSQAALDKLAKIHRLYSENTVNVATTGPVEFVLKVDPQDIP